MITDIDIWRSAGVMMKQHGADAAIYAAMRADALLAQGDINGHRAWLRIIGAIEALEPSAARLH